MEVGLFIRLIFSTYWWVLLISSIIICELSYWTIIKDYENDNFIGNKTLSILIGIVITLLLVVIVGIVQTFNFNTIIKVSVGLSALILIYVSNYMIHKIRKDSI